jgi:hypothetical protein
MNSSYFYKNRKMKKSLHVLVRALVPAYVHALDCFFCFFTDRKPMFYAQKISMYATIQ